MITTEKMVDDAYYLGAYNGILSASEAIVAVIDKAKEDGMDVGITLQLIRKLASENVHLSRDNYNDLAEEMKK